jgi:hypothetical protein
MPLPTYTELAAKLTQFFTASDKAYQIVNGPASGTGSTVSVTSGTLETFAKIQARLPSPLALTANPVNGTTSGVTGQLAIVTISGVKTLFICSNGTAKTWIGLASDITTEQVIALLVGAVLADVSIGVADYTGLTVSPNIFARKGSVPYFGNTPLSFALSLATTGSYTTTFAQSGSITVTLPSTNATMARTDSGQTFTGTHVFGNGQNALVVGRNDGTDDTDQYQLTIKSRSYVGNKTVRFMDRSGTVLMYFTDQGKIAIGNTCPAPNNFFSLRVGSGISTHGGEAAVCAYDRTDSNQFWQFYSNSGTMRFYKAHGTGANEPFTIASDGTVTLTGIITSGNFKRGAGSPNGSVTGNPGDLYTNTSGGANTTLYVKESGTGTNTGWVAK